MKNQSIIIMIAFCIGAITAHGQEREHIGIHQEQSELHHWDDVRLDARVPEFARGKNFAASGDAKNAIVEFQKGARKNKAYGFFNIGLVYYYRHNYPVALQYFQKSERAQRDSLSHAYIDASKRLIKQRLNMRKQ
jgi:tetratricopeptide (TPR) repeat protein